MTAPTLETPRLLLRPFVDDDINGLASLCADPEVMRYFPEMLDRAGSERFAGRIKDHFSRHGFGPWSVEIKGSLRYAGFVGLMVPAFESHFTPCVEVGWRLARAVWGQGYATEAARVSAEFAFSRLKLCQLVSMTVPANLQSRRVMERLGMTRMSVDDFMHPALPDGNPLRPHVLYRLRRSQFGR